MIHEDADMLLDVTQLGGGLAVFQIPPLGKLEKRSAQFNAGDPTNAWGLGGGFLAGRGFGQVGDEPGIGGGGFRRAVLAEIVPLPFRGDVREISRLEMGEFRRAGQLRHGGAPQTKRLQV